MTDDRYEQRPDRPAWAALPTMPWSQVEQAVRQEERGRHPIPEQQSGAAPQTVRPPAPAEEVSAELQRRYGAIWEMAERGLNAEAIARASGQPVGHVELVLGLRRGLVRG